MADESGGAWVAEWGGGLAYVEPGADVVRMYGPVQGVPEDLSFVAMTGDALVLVTRDDLYRVTSNHGGVEVVRDTAAVELVAPVVGSVSDGITMLTDSVGRLWVAGRHQVRALVQHGDEWADVTPAPLRHLPDVTAIEADSGGTIWVAAGGDLYRLEASAHDRYEALVPTLVRSVTANGEPVPLADAVAVPYGRSLRLQFVAAAYNNSEETEYRTQLIGHDVARSRWSRERYRDYTNLPPGEYVFRVEGRTAQGVPTGPASIGLTIPAPWYLTPWARLLYAVGVLGIIGGVAHVASRHQRRRADAERVRADELDRLNAELRRVDKLKDDMLANTSHELRTPLTAILGFSEMLVENDDPKVRSLARHVLSGGHRLLSTVNALLEIAQLRAGRTVLHPVSTDAAALARQVANELEPLAARKGLALAVVPSGLAVAARLDPDAFVRILTNLIGNAIKFTSTGAVTVSVDGVGVDLQVSVRDTGRGIDPAFLPRLFDDFEQASTGYGRAAEGNGLGLAITRRLVDLMGGEIDVESEVGVGTTFRVTIPGTVETALGAKAPVADRTPAEVVGA
ncbi:sensor histidine kinase [Rubrivirga marina]|uniref:sensor histidine kinase n=1 Tax=Rubrivirga marina TaxID=1196024 RepID=UPI0015C80598|nr:HAMP domain-containing sensor histidine kinase [Rubrivirga marina]